MSWKKNFRILRSYLQEKKDLEEFQKANENNMEKNLAVVKLRSLFGPLLDLITGISLLLTLIIGGKMVLNGTVSVGQFVAFNSYIGMLVWPMIACGDCINTFSQAEICLVLTERITLYKRVPRRKNMRVFPRMKPKPLRSIYF